MKKSIFMLALLLCVCMSARSQTKAVKEAFAERFPNAGPVKWDNESKSEYEANFKMDGVDMSAVFSNDGTWKETETSIPVSDLPQAVADAAKRKYSKGKITGASKIVRSDGSTVYEADIKVKSRMKELLFNEDGKTVK
jgi:putative PepSY-like beta-lactamase-inhibitor